MGITCFTNKKKLSKFAVIAFFLNLLDCDWIWIGLSIHFEEWIWTWIVNQFTMDLDRIDNPKTIGLSNNLEDRLSEHQSDDQL